MTGFDIRVPGVVDVEGLVLEPGQVTVLYGPNGAGKTTLLRRLAGLDSERHLDCHYLPQHPYLFRGTAGWNLGLGLDEEQTAWAAQLAQRLGVGDLLSSPVQNLSGGERQRLALARTLAHDEEWVLLDEPLSAVDRADRDRVLTEVASALEGRSVVVVTHDLDVAVALADRIAVISSGRLLQQGPLVEVLTGPADTAVAWVLGVRNVIDGTATRTDGLTVVESQAIKVVGRGEVEGHARALFGAEAVAVSPPSTGPGSPRNRWQGRVAEVRRRAHLVEVKVDVGQPVVALLTPGALEELALEPGSEVTLSVKATSVVVVPA
ncbi:MAG: ATP-binding cassette domain-containing protein [Acidimicrobiia bacterium]